METKVEETGLDIRKDSQVFPLADSEVFPGLDDVALLKDVYRKWMQDETISIDEAAVACGADPRTVAYWADKGDWLSHRLRTVRLRGKEAMLSLELKRQEMREDKVLQQIQIATDISVKIGKAINAPKTVITRDGEALQVEHSAKDLKELAEAARASGEVLGRFLGVAESKPQALPQDQAADGSEAGEEKTQRPLVVVVRGGGLPQVRMTETAKADIIDVS